MYKQLLSVLILCVFFLFSCLENNPEKLIGTWKGKSTTTGVSSEMCNISKVGEKLVLDSYTLFNKATTYIDNAGGTTPKEGIRVTAGQTVRHKKGELIYDKQANDYKWNEGSFTINVRLVDDDKLLLETPAEQKTYTRVKN